MYHILLTLLFLLLSITPAVADTWSGKVIGVSDGDTITVLKNKTPVKIRLYGIDTPESGQAYGNKATKYMKKLVSRKTVQVTEYDIDKYGRSVSVVKAGSINVNRSMIQAGYAWQYRKYCKESFCHEWLELESNVRSAKTGLWADKNAQPPWEWRKLQRSNTTGKKVGGLYHGNSKSYVVHSSRCQYFNCKNCTVPFGSLEAAIKAGYRRHKQCIP